MWGEARKPGFATRIVTSLSQQIAELSNALTDPEPDTDEQWEHLRFLSHRLKSGAGTVGAVMLASSLQAIETAARERSTAALHLANVDYAAQIQSALQSIREHLGDGLFLRR